MRCQSPVVKYSTPSTSNDVAAAQKPQEYECTNYEKMTKSRNIRVRVCFGACIIATVGMTITLWFLTADDKKTSHDIASARTQRYVSDTMKRSGARSDNTVPSTFSSFTPRHHHDNHVKPRGAGPHGDTAALYNPREDYDALNDPEDDQVPADDLTQHTGGQGEEGGEGEREEERSDVGERIRHIKCDINGEYSVGCVQEGGEVFIPFSFVHKYFEVYGKMSTAGGMEHFEWQHSYSHVYKMKERYSTAGVFMSFEHYNVEVRDRVKCISGPEGVPVSTQWGVQGYFYPIQIAQYGLSHYSMYITQQKTKGETSGEEESRVHVICDGQVEDVCHWSVREGGVVERGIDSERQTHVFQFRSSESIGMPTEVYIPIPDTVNSYLGNMDERSATDRSLHAYLLSFSVKFLTNGSITVVVEVTSSAKSSVPRLYELRYVTSHDVMVSGAGNHITYDIGDVTSWKTFTRDLLVDLSKGVAVKYFASGGGSGGKGRKHPPKFAIQRVVRVELRGTGWVGNISLASSAHLELFFNAADWFTSHQDAGGGWPIPVTRRLADGKLELPPGWYSAMAQGQAMSVLARAYLRTRERKYLDCALRATALFDVASERGGVLAMFAGQYPWYEEYPTTPSSYVLNGFIYSLIGLYDLIAAAPPDEAKEAERLYKAGLASLESMLALFDTGSGSVYDLRHVTIAGAAPNVARWDYHATHVNQLLLLASIESNPLYRTVANRWLGYMMGRRAAHN